MSRRLLNSLSVPERRFIQDIKTVAERLSADIAADVVLSSGLQTHLRSLDQARQHLETHFGTHVSTVQLGLSLCALTRHAFELGGTPDLIILRQLAKFTSSHYAVVLLVDAQRNNRPDSARTPGAAS